MKKVRLSLSQKRSMAGYVFTLPFILGFIVLFLSPFLLYIKMGFSDFSVSTSGMLLDDVGFQNYYTVLFVQNDFLKDTFTSLGYMLLTCPAILIFSFFIATLLNSKFRGRTFVRVMFFLPFIFTTGIAQMVMSTSFFGGVAGTTFSTVSSSMSLTKGFLDLFALTVDSSVLDYFLQMISQIFIIVTSSSMQILIFLAALQSIPPSLYEASSVEGSTAWEDFWKITLPMISPMMVVNAAYTIIDSLTGTSNTMIKTIYNQTMVLAEFGTGSAMGLMYLTIVCAILFTIISIANKFVFYENR